MAQLMLINPKRRVKRKTRANPKRRKTKKRVVRRRSVARKSPVRRKRRVRRNPKLSITSIQRDAIMPAAIGGVGALGVDVAFGMLPIPANFKTGAIGSVAKLAAAVVLGQFIGRFTNRKTGEAFTVGAVTIQAYNLVKGLAQNALPNLPLSGDPSLAYFQPDMGYTNAAVSVTGDSPNIQDYNSTQVGEYLNGMGEYLNGDTGYAGY